MSKKQWGHGYYAGYKDGYKKKSREEWLKKIKKIISKNPQAHIVPVISIGNGGCYVDPKFEKYLCCQVSTCLNQDSDGKCGFCYGYVNKNKILCLGELPNNIED